MQLKMHPTLQRIVLIHVLALSEVVKMNLSKKGELSHRIISLDEKDFIKMSSKKKMSQERFHQIIEGMTDCW